MDFSDILCKEDLAVFEKARHGQLMGFGKKPCLLLVDMTYAFADPSFELCSGELPGKAVENSKILLDMARKKQILVVYTTGITSSANPADWGASRKRAVNKEFKKDKGNRIVEIVYPKAGEIVIEKPKASAFFGTNFLATLIHHQIDTLIVTGISTSGCVRATVVDAASYEFYVIVPEECVGDRAELSHKVSLLDMHMKYADVIPMSTVLNYMEKQT